MRRSALQRLDGVCALHLLLSTAIATTVSASEDRLIGHWEFEEQSGTSALDSSGNNNTGTIIGATFSSGLEDGALEFDGVDDYLFATERQSGGISGGGLDMGPRDWSVTASIRTDSSGMLVTKMGFVGGNNPDGWGVSVSANGTLGVHVRKGGVGEVNVYDGNGEVVNDNQWHHIAVVFDRDGEITRYVDGQPTGSRYWMANLTGQSIDNDKQFRIGARDQPDNEIFFKGAIDQVRVYGRVLSGVEVAALAGVDPPDPISEPAGWSDPVSLVSEHGRLAVANRVHVVGHSGGNLVHRSSADNGATWSSPRVIASAGQNYPMQYGGLYAADDTVYLLTAAGHMGPASRHLDFRKSVDNGVSWTDPIRITGAGEEIRRANIVANENNVHVFGGQSGAGGYGTGIFYFRSTSGGARWDAGKLLHANADASAKLAVDGTTLHVAFGMKLSPESFGGRTYYLRSTDNGATWSDPVFIGEVSAESDIQARQQIAAADGHVLAIWQREGDFPGAPLPPDRLGYNRSVDAGITWEGQTLLPGNPGVNRNHQQIWMVPGGAVHIAWCHGAPGDSSSPTGYMFSPDYGATWFRPEIAISTPGGNLPHSLVADTKWVHILAEPGAGTYARRPVPLVPRFTSIQQDDVNTIVLEWNGRATLQAADRLTGPWQEVADAVSPHPVGLDRQRRFFRLDPLARID